MDNNYFEILAPVGNYQMLEAAIKAKANAIYLGGKLFNARAYAENFSIDDIKEIVKLCHSHEIKVYITINTLLHDNELNEALNYVIDLYNIDIDAIIIQDLGLLSLIKKFLPKLDVHASTQINIYNYYGAKIMKELGFKRIVLARETPLEEIKYIAKNLDIELEVFIHGSLCVATSGQCLMSSYIGGRSGNRGKCAQPCRKEYRVIDSNLKPINNHEGYKSYLSTKDLCAINTIEDLKDIGVKSFKIEGRMKKPEYVYTVVKVYKNAIFDKTMDISKLEEVSNRGYTKGLINSSFGIDFIEINRAKNKKGKTVGQIINSKGKKSIVFYESVIKGDILLVETEKGKIIQYTVTKEYKLGDSLTDNYIYDAKINSKVNRTSSIDIKKELNSKIIDNKKDIIITFIGKIGKKPILLCKYNDLEISSEVEYTILKAINQPIEKSKIVEQLSKFGNTNYFAHNINIEIDDNIFVPVKILNQLRRNLVLKLDQLLNTFNTRDIVTNVEVDFELIEKNQSQTNINLELIYPKSNFNNNFGDLYTNFKLYNKSGYFIKIPRLATKENIDDFYESIKDLNIDGFLINNIGDIQFIKENFTEYKIIGDLGLNVLNSKSFLFLKTLGLSRVTLSTELNLYEINEMLPYIDEDYEIIIHGPLVSMVTKSCPFSLIKGCVDDSSCQNCKYSNNYYLENENNELFLVNRMNGYSEIFHNKILSSYEIINNINFNNSGNVRVIDFDNESNVIDIYNERINKNKYKKNLFRESQYSTIHFKKGIN